MKTIESIEYGYCHCGCGQKTSIIERNTPSRGLVKGEPRKYLSGHNNYQKGKDRPQPIKNDDGTVTIFLTHGKTTIIDATDGDLAQYLWYLQIDHKRKTNSTNYAVRKPLRRDGVTQKMNLHRVIMERVLGRKLSNGEQIDHKDCNGLNNRRDNLRLATITQNQQNKRIRSDNTSGFKGVSYIKNKNRWAAQIQVNGKRLTLGQSFKTPEEAYQAYCLAAKEYHGNFANIGGSNE